MPVAFHVLDLPSQAPAVQRLLSGRPDDEKLAWLRLHGTLAPVPTPGFDARPVFAFESSVGLQCLFFITGDEFVFIGDHTTYAVHG